MDKGQSHRQGQPGKGTNMSKESFQIVFTGEAVEAGTMDVHDFAPALLALGDLCREANRVLNGEKAKVIVNVRTDFRRGSFQVDLDLVQTLLEHAKALFRGDDIKSAKDLLQGLGLLGSATALGVLELIRFLKGRVPSEATTFEDRSTKFTVEGNTIQVNGDVTNLYVNSNVRDSFNRFTKPLEKDGIDSIEVRQNNNIVEAVPKQERDYFSHLPAIIDTGVGEGIVEREITALLEVIRVAFEERYRWTLSDGESKYNVRVQDEEFRRQIDNRQVSFSKGDILHCKIRTVITPTHTGSKTEYTLLKVLGIRRIDQQRLPNI